MKLKLNKYLKMGLICIITIVAVIIIFFLVREVRHPNVVEKKAVLYSYSQKVEINYRVFFEPNILYNDDSLGEGNIYISEFANHVNTYFNYEFRGDAAAEIKGSYEVLAMMEGYFSDDKKKTTVWEKEFTILPKTDFATAGNKISIAKNIPINLRQYNDFANNVIKDSKINSQVKLSVFMKINLEAATENGPVKETLSPGVIIPLNTKYFEIQKSQTGEKLGEIKGTQKLQIPVDRTTVIVYSISLVVLLLVLLYLTFFTITVEKSPLIKTLDRIFKNHASRLVAVNGEITDAPWSLVKVKSIDDLVRVADEIGKPIIYRYSSNAADINRFYVFDDLITFVFDLTAE
ncbi:DUF5305 family protein [Phosphitispora sp. TUW77]|uniref:DUF5305 family protein n=1 Tax=Phosphitispora sp. TUW77 TaxID=3152361 RepID=UPI003AB44B19